MAGEQKVTDDLRGAVNSNFGRMVFDGVLAVAVMATGGFVTFLVGEIKDLNRETASIRVEAAAFREKVATENVKKDEVRRDFDEIKTILRDIQNQQRRSGAGVAVAPGMWRDGREVNR